jgi:hypothetical protein
MLKKSKQFFVNDLIERAVGNFRDLNLNNLIERGEIKWSFLAA